MLDLWEHRFEPCEQSLSRDILHAQPDNDGRNLGLTGAVGEVFVLGDDRRLIGQGVVPDVAIISVPQAKVLNVLRIVAQFPQSPSE